MRVIVILDTLARNSGTKREYRVAETDDHLDLICPKESLSKETARKVFRADQFVFADERAAKELATFAASKYDPPLPVKVLRFPGRRFPF